MSHKKIWLAIRELEDQQARDYKRIWDAIKRLTEAADLNVALQKKVWGHLESLDDQQAEARKFQRVGETNIRTLFEKAESLANQQILADFTENAVSETQRAQIKEAFAQIRKLEKEAEPPSPPLSERFTIHEGHISTHETLIYDLGNRIAKLEGQALDDEWVGDLAKVLKSHVANEIAGANKTETASMHSMHGLADYIANEIPEVPGLLCEDAADIAIQLLKRYRAALDSVKTNLATERRGTTPFINLAYLAARDALTGEDDD